MNSVQIPDGAYNIILKKLYSSISFAKEIILSKDNLGSDSVNFRINQCENVNEKNTTFYTIEYMKTKLYLGIKTNNNNSKYDTLILTSEIIENETLSFYFNFSKVESSVYTIQSKKGCFLKGESLKIICAYETPRQMSHFHLLKLFSEVKKNKKDELILENEPIDVLIKYIDLSDPNLVREGIPQIKKDNENEELKYSVRSILKNIPWVRKIFILMPNEKVRYFKDYDLIKEKIVYVKDKDFLGYDSANSHAFQFRLWKMKDFGISNNFIIMDDDCFIGQPLNKSDFFYVQNNTVVPAIIPTIYQVHTEKTFLREYNNIKKKLSNSRIQSTNTFLYTMYNTYFFFIEYFDGPIIVPYFTHNAIPSNVNDLKEIYDLVYDSKYKNGTLDSLSRHIDSLQFQTSVNVYTFNKYNRKVNLINYNYIDNDKTLKGDFNFPLFCINTGNNREYSKISFPETRLVMDKLFPDPTPYEIVDYNTIPKLAYNVIKTLEDTIKNLKNNEDKKVIVKLQSENQKKKKFIERCDTMIEKYQIKNRVSLNRSIVLKKQLDSCMSKFNYIESEVKQLEKQKKYSSNNSLDYEDMKNELEKHLEMKKNNIIKLNMYESGINENKKKIEIIINKDKKLCFIAYFQLGIIMTFLVLFIIYCFIKNKINFNTEEEENREKFSLLNDIKIRE